ncbi:hypothetical protein MJH12_14315, partial [bacterium]|nr:hypothetical protein [bacterium]
MSVGACPFIGVVGAKSENEVSPCIRTKCTFFDPSNESCFLANMGVAASAYMDTLKQSHSDHESKNLEFSLQKMSEQDRLERADLYFNRGEQYYLQGKIFEAGAEFKKVVLADPEHLMSNLKLGILASLNKQFDDAILYFKNVINISPDYFPAYVKQIKQYSYMYQDYISKVEMYDRVIDRLKSRQDDKNLGSSYALAMGHLLLSGSQTLETRIKSATKVLNTAIKSNQNPYLHWALKYAALHPELNQDQLDYATAIQECNKALKTKQQSDQSYFELAETYEIQSRNENKPEALELAIENYNLSIEANPYHLDSLLRLAIIHEERFEYNESILLLKKCTLHDPYNAYALAKLAQLYKATRFHEQSIVKFRSFLEISESLGFNPYNNILSLDESSHLDILAIRLDLADTYEQFHNIDEAINEYKLILNDKPDSILAGKKLIDLNWQKYQNQSNASQTYENLIKNYKQAEFFSPNNAILTYLLGYAYLTFHESFSYKEEILLKAEQQFEKSIRMDSELKEAYFSLHHLYLNTEFKTTHSESFE